MIEIVKEGKKKFEITCIKCGCVFTYGLEDLKGTRYVTCPECHEECRHPDQNLGNVHRSLYESYKQSTGSETCLICGDSIPEGRQVCKKCENNVEREEQNEF